MPLADILKEPFGPYRDVDILSPAAKNLALDDVRLFKQENGRFVDTGLTQTDFLNSTAPGVYFTGILQVDTRKWFSAAGVQKVETDIRKRHIERFDRPIGITLSELYNNVVFKEKTIIKIMLRCEKNLNASFLIINPDGLIFKSRRKEALYIIASMHIQTYRMSYRFLQRYRLLALITEITTTTAVPYHERTVDWLCAQVKEHHHKNHNSRLIPNLDDDSDIDEDSVFRIAKRTRHVSTSEVLPILAKEAPWLLAQQMSIRTHSKRQISIRSLNSFCLNPNAIKKQSENDLVRILKKQLAPDWNLQKYRSFMKEQQKREKQAKTAGYNPPDDDEMDVDSDVPEVPSDHVLPMAGGFSSDSNESVVSSSEASDSDAQLPAREVHRPNFRRAPLIPPERGKRLWTCPSRGCPKKFDLLIIARQNKLENFSVVGNPDMQWAWREAVRNHFTEVHPE